MVQQKRLLDKTQLYKLQRDEYQKKVAKYKKQVEEASDLAKRYRNERNTYQTQLKNMVKNSSNQYGNINLISNNGAFNIYNAN